MSLAGDEGASFSQAVVALALANARYWPSVAPTVRAELRRWERHARSIQDPTLRAHALGKLHEEHFNAEVAATLATLAPRRRRRDVVTASVAFQVIYDYLDAVTEQPVAEPLSNGRQLYRAFAAALGGDEQPVDYYRHHPQRYDGGYLDALVAACRAGFQGLPGAALVAPIALRTAIRCGEAQTRTHAVARDGPGQLAAWAAREAAGSDLTWWETAAGAAASVLSVHALIAAASDPRTTRADAVRIEAAYLPISALTTLLDSLVDRDDDDASGSHEFLSYYENDRVIVERLRAVTREAMRSARSLPHAAHHAMSVAGAAAYYLSTPGARSKRARRVARVVIDELRPLIGPVMQIFRVWRLAKAVHRLRPDAKRGADVAPRSDSLLSATEILPSAPVRRARISLL